jgi:hypothetical protein
MPQYPLNEPYSGYNCHVATINLASEVFLFSTNWILNFKNGIIGSGLTRK